MKLIVHVQVGTVTYDHMTQDVDAAAAMGLDGMFSHARCDSVGGFVCFCLTQSHATPSRGGVR